jgi:hypothetical protein
MFQKVSLLLIFLFIFAILGCDRAGDRKRPPGYLKIGLISTFNEGDNYLPELRLMLRKDSYGYSVMSTECTYDLTPLKKIVNKNSYIWKSDYTNSSYNADGTVITEPATVKLPYYELVLSASKYGGEIDTLYVSIGKEVTANWRLKIK